MAISPNDQAQPQPRVEPQQPYVEQPQQPNEGFMKKPLFTLTSGGLFGSPIGRGLGSEVYSKFKDKMKAIFESVLDPNAEMAIIDLDNVNEPALMYSSIIIAMRFKNRPNLGVSYYLILLEDTGDKLLPAMDNINGQQVEILRLTCDAFDDVLYQKAYYKVAGFFNTDNIHYVDGTVIPADFNLEDNRAIYSIALNAGWACGTDLETRDPEFVDLNLAASPADSQLNINVAFGKQTLLDATGLPMRSDLVINFDSRKNNQGPQRNQSVNTGDKELKISTLSGFIDVAWIEQGQNAFNVAYAQNQQIRQKYAARLIITNLASNHLYTMSSVLLALATAVSVRDDNNWIQTFRPAGIAGREVDMSDIGALNIEANLSKEPSGFGTRVDTKSDSFRLEDLGQLVAALICPGLMISMDCPEAGPQSWYLSVFNMASKGSPGAYSAIFSAAQQLTNFNFGRNFAEGEPIFTDVHNRIHNGYYVDKQMQRRDIRDIDHLAVCNLVGERDPRLIRAWANTFLGKNEAAPVRMAARKRMIQNLTGESAVFTGFSERVTFTSRFLDALVTGIAAAGVSVRVNTPLSGSDITATRGVATFADQALLQPGQTFMSAGGQQWQPNYQMGSRYGRW